jgi:hypothetical protein
VGVIRALIEGMYEKEVVLGLLGAIGVGALIVYNYEFIRDSLESQFNSSADDVPGLEKLTRIKKAAGFVQSEFTNLIAKCKKNRGKIDGEILKIAAEITSDVDFIYGELDQVRGGALVKRRRRQQAEELQKLSKDVDELMEVLKERNKPKEDV